MSNDETDRIAEAITRAGQQCDALYQESLAMFKGIQCVVDQSLSGTGYVMHVSPQLWNDLQASATKIKQGNKEPDNG